MLFTLYPLHRVGWREVRVLTLYYAISGILANRWVTMMVQRNKEVVENDFVDTKCFKDFFCEKFSKVQHCNG